MRVQFHASRGAHRLRTDRQDHSFSAHDQRPRARASVAREGRRNDRHLQSARLVTRLCEDSEFGEKRVKNDHQNAVRKNNNAMYAILERRDFRRWSFHTVCYLGGYSFSGTALEPARHFERRPFLGPTARPQASPGQRPGKTVLTDKALKGRNKVCRPFRALFFLSWL